VARLFVAVDVGDDVRAAAAAVRRSIEVRLAQVHENRPRLVWTAPSGLHVTLKFLGEQPEDRVPAIVKAIEQPIVMAPFQVVWRGVGAFPSPREPRTLWLGVVDGAASLGAVEAEVARRFSAPGLAIGAAAETRPFHAHVTLARVKVTGARLDWRAMLESAAMAPVSSVVSQVTLYRSRGLPGGAGYEALANGRLNG
jgi:2'-5' RNA ligase